MFGGVFCFSIEFWKLWGKKLFFSRLVLKEELQGKTVLKIINLELYVLHVIPGVSELKLRGASPDKTI